MLFDLTGDELFKAYVEQEHLFDVRDVKDHFDEDQYSADEVEKIAWEARRQCDKYDLDFACAIDEALVSLDLMK